MGSEMGGHNGPDTGVEERRHQQVELYGESVDALARRCERLLGLGVPALADVIGLSVPMLNQLLTGERVRIGNPIAIARLTRLREFADQLTSGEASRDDIALTVAQIRASTTPARPSRVTAVAHSGRSGQSGPSSPSGPRRRTELPDTGPPSVTPSALGYARTVVARHVPPTPAYRWPLLEGFTRTETWVKHENHNPTGAFKVRGGLNFVERLRVSGLAPAGLVTATRGNHGQSVAFAGRHGGIPVTIVVPEGNSPDKNDAMVGYGAELVVHGQDFQAAREYAAELADERGLLTVPSFHPWLVEGVATYAAELHESVPDLDVVYVPVGMGSGICAHIVVRDLLGLRTEVVGVVAANAPAYARSFEAGEVVTTETADTFVDGVACRTPDPVAVAMIRRGASRILEISEDQAREAMAMTYRTTHNLPEPAGSLSLAGLLADRDRVAGRKVAVMMTGGNCDFDLLRQALDQFS
jgi:threonine dehydratase